MRRWFKIEILQSFEKENLPSLDNLSVGRYYFNLLRVIPQCIMWGRLPYLSTWPACRHDKWKQHWTHKSHCSHWWLV